MKSKKSFLIFTIFFLLNIFFLNNIFAAIEHAKNPKIVTFGSGINIVAIWTKNDSSNDIIQISTSSDFGSTWSTPINLSATGQNADEPQLASYFANYTLYAIWKRSNGTNDIIQFSRSKDSGATWSTPIDLSLTGQTATSPEIFMDRLPLNPYAIWSRSNGSNDLIQFRKSSNYGDTWNDIIDLSATGQNAVSPDLCENDSQHSVYAVWTRSNGTNDIVQLRHSSDFGNTFDSVIDLSDTNQMSNNPKVHSIKNSIYTLWAESNGINDVITFRGSNNNGTTWQNAISLSDGSQNAKEAQFISDIDGDHLYSVWTRSDGVNDRIEFTNSTNYGISWSTPIIFSASGQNAKDPQITTTYYGKYVYSVWARSDGLNDRIEFIKSTDFANTFSSVITLSDTGQTAKNPQIATDFYGQCIYVIWARSDGTKDVIQMVVSTDSGATFSSPVTISN